MFPTRATGVVVRSAGMSHYNFLLADLARRIIVPQKVPEFMRTFVAENLATADDNAGFACFALARRTGERGA